MPDTAAHGSLLKRIEEIHRLLAAGDAGGLVAHAQPSMEKAVRLEALHALVEVGGSIAESAIGHVLQDARDPLREELIETLAARPGDESLVLLALLLPVPDLLLRSRIVRILAGREEHSAFNYLVRATRDSHAPIARLGRRLLEERVRARAEQLAELRPETLDGIMEELDFDAVWPFLAPGTAANVRQAALKRLSACRSEHAADFLVSTLLAAEPPHCFTALEAIERNDAVGGDALRPVLEWGSAEVFSPVFAVYARRTGNEGVELLIENLKHAESVVRRAAVSGLFRLFGQRIVPVVAPLLADQDPVVCTAVLEALREAPRQLVEEALITAATRGPAEIRPLALALAARKGICTPELVGGFLNHLNEALKDPRPEGEALDTICDIFAVLKESQTIYLLVPLIYAARSASPRLRRAAMEVLVEYPAEQRLEALVYLQGANDMTVVTAVAFTLAEAGHPGALVPLIRVAMGRKREDVRRARQILGKLEETKNIERLCELVHSPFPVVKTFGIEKLKEMGDPRAVAMLLQAIEEGNEEMQRIALARLADLGNVDAQEAREKGTAEAMQAVDQEAMKDLSQQADPRAIDILLKATEDEDDLVQFSAVDALDKFVSEEKVVNRLIELIGYGAVPVRQRAVEILGRNQVVAAVDALIAAFGNIFLRSYAEEALRLIGDRRGYLAVLRRKKREKLFPKKAKLEREKAKKAREAKHGVRV